VAACRSSTKPVEAKVDEARVHLQTIAAAYEFAVQRNGRPPQNLDELRPFLQDRQQPGKTLDVLRSPNDGENYVIIWGVDYRELATQVPNPYVVLAYEKSGKAGKRYVLVRPNFVTVMTDAEFRTAPFPPGHQPQF
jgi:hypothetical protein